jgi:hypothetical protein
MAICMFLHTIRKMEEYIAYIRPERAIRPSIRELVADSYLLGPIQQAGSIPGTLVTVEPFTIHFTVQLIPLILRRKTFINKI